MHKHQIQQFWRISLFDSAPVKKAYEARTHWYRWPFRLIYQNQILKISVIKDLTETIKNQKYMSA